MCSCRLLGKMCKVSAILLFFFVGIASVVDRSICRELRKHVAEKSLLLDRSSGAYFYYAGG